MAKKSAHKSSRRQQLQGAFEALLEATGVPPQSATRQTSKRAAALWHDHLLAAEGVDPLSVFEPHRVVKSDLQKRNARVQTPVCVTNMGIHLVCPHHLTIAFGRAHVAYLPQQEVVGFGTLSRLAHACTARLILQEDATLLMAEALQQGLRAKAAVVCLSAVHPCHNVLYPRSHATVASTWAQAGTKAHSQMLRSLLQSEADKHEKEQTQ